MQTAVHTLSYTCRLLRHGGCGRWGSGRVAGQHGVPGPFQGPGPVMTQLVHSHGPVAETAAVLRSPNPPFIQVLPFSVLRARGVSTVKPSPNTHILPASASLWSFKSVSQVFLYLVPQPALSVSPLSAGPVRRCCRAALWCEFACSGAFVKHAEVWPLTTSL